ncbi:GumC family protein [Saccharicrinis sp. FJH2]|uniref:GumC family protein n=1 Tax=Saccharicrinis sp. FJH65 TaxID=3344659 RepID=UPI0035F2962F
MKNLEGSAYSLNEEAFRDSNGSLKRYVKNWPWFLLFGLIGIIIGFISFKLTPTSYQVESKILIKGENNPLQSNIKLDNILGTNTSSNMSNQIEILQSFTNYKRALENLNWQTTWYLLNSPFDIELYKSEPAEVAIPLGSNNLYGPSIFISILDDTSYRIKIDDKNEYSQQINIDQIIEFGKPFKSDYFNFILYKNENTRKGDFYFKFNNINRMAQNYLERVNVEIPNINSEVIKMQVTGNIPKKEADFLNELNNVFILLGVEEEEKNSENSLNFITEQLAMIKDSLTNSEKVFSDYRKKNKVVDLSQEANFIYQKLEEIETEKYESGNRLKYYKNLQEYLDDSERLKQISSPSVAGINDDNLSSMLQKLTELYNRREILSYSVKEKTPSFILLEKEIDMIKNSLNENLSNLISNTKTEISSINSRYSEIQNRLKNLPDTERELIGIQRNFELNNTMYNYMLKKKAEAELSHASTAPKVQIIDKALPEASTVVGPNMLINVALGAGTGLFIPFLFLFLTDIFRSTISSKEEVELISDLTILDGIISSGNKKQLPVVDNPRSGIAESFRRLRHNIKTLVPNPDKCIISINSILPEEGKSFISSNLAVIFAMANKKVLLVGGDIRKPKLDVLFDTSNDNGLTSYLNGDSDFDSIISKTQIPNLYIAPAGEVPENPNELLENGRFETFIKVANSKFDYIILDNAPFSLVTDGIITSKIADLSLFILRIDKSPKRNIKDIHNIIDINGMKNVAIVMNGIHINGVSKGYLKKGYGSYEDVRKKK